HFSSVSHTSTAHTTSSSVSPYTTLFRSQHLDPACVERPVRRRYRYKSQTPLSVARGAYHRQSLRHGLLVPTKWLWLRQAIPRQYALMTHADQQTPGSPLSRVLLPHKRWRYWR